MCATQQSWTLKVINYFKIQLHMKIDNIFDELVYTNDPYIALSKCHLTKLLHFPLDVLPEDHGIRVKHKISQGCIDSLMIQVLILYPVHKATKRLEFIECTHPGVYERLIYLREYPACIFDVFSNTQNIFLSQIMSRMYISMVHHLSPDMIDRVLQMTNSVRTIQFGKWHKVFMHNYMFYVRVFSCCLFKENIALDKTPDEIIMDTLNIEYKGIYHTFSIYVYTLYINMHTHTYIHTYIYIYITTKYTKCYNYKQQFLINEAIIISE